MIFIGRNDFESENQEGVRPLERNPNPNPKDIPVLINSENPGRSPIFAHKFINPLENLRLPCGGMLKMGRCLNLDNQGFTGHKNIIGHWDNIPHSEQIWPVESNITGFIGA